MGFVTVAGSALRVECWTTVAAPITAKPMPTPSASDFAATTNRPALAALPTAIDAPTFADAAAEADAAAGAAEELAAALVANVPLMAVVPSAAHSACQLASMAPSAGRAALPTKSNSRSPDPSGNSSSQRFVLVMIRPPRRCERSGSGASSRFWRKRDGRGANANARFPRARIAVLRSLRPTSPLARTIQKPPAARPAFPTTPDRGSRAALALRVVAVDRPCGCCHTASPRPTLRGAKLRYAGSPTLLEERSRKAKFLPWTGRRTSPNGDGQSETPSDP